jgi:hypothetical protein
MHLVRTDFQPTCRARYRSSHHNLPCIVDLPGSRRLHTRDRRIAATSLSDGTRRDSAGEELRGGSERPATTTDLLTGRTFLQSEGSRFRSPMSKRRIAE